MAIPLKKCGSRLQAGTASDSAINTPNGTVNNFHLLRAVTNITGNRLKKQQGAITEYGTELRKIPAEWVSATVESFDLDVRRNFREFASCFNSYTGGFPVVLAVGCNQHDFAMSIDPANKHFFTRQYQDTEGVYHHTSCEPLGFKLEGADGLVQVTMPFVGQHVSMAQFHPTATVGPATYNGTVYVRQTSVDQDSAALTYNVECNTAGAIGGGVASVETKLSTDPGFGAARLVYNNTPFDIESQAGVFSGLQVMFTIGVNNLLAATDAWTASTRGTATSPTYPDMTVFAPHRYRSSVTLAGAALRHAPKSMSVELKLPLRTDQFVWGKDVVEAHNFGGKLSLTGEMLVEIEDRQWFNLATHATTVSNLVIALEGDYIGASVVYRQLWQLTVTLLEIDFEPKGLSQDGIPLYAVKWNGLPSTIGGVDIATLRVQNDITNAFS